MCKFMLDSNLIKKYFKAGLWSKIMLVVFTLVLAVGGIVGYFLHKNDDVYAANKDENPDVILYFYIGRYNGIGPEGEDESVYKFNKYFESVTINKGYDGEKTYPIGDDNAVYIKFTELKPVDGRNVIKTYHLNLKENNNTTIAADALSFQQYVHGQGSASIAYTDADTLSISTYYGTDDAWDSEKGDTFGKYKISVDIKETVKTTFGPDDVLKENFPVDKSLSHNTKQPGIGVLSGREDDGSGKYKQHFKGDDMRNDKIDIDIRTNVENRLLFCKELSNYHPEENVYNYLVDKVTIMENSNSIFTREVYDVYDGVSDVFWFDKDKVDNPSVKVHMMDQIFETPVAMGKVNGHNAEGMALGNFISNVASACSKLKDGNLGKFTEISNLNLENTTDTVTAKVAKAENWETGFKFDVRDNDFYVDSITISYKDKNGEEKEATVGMQGVDYPFLFGYDYFEILKIKVNFTIVNYKKLTGDDITYEFSDTDGKTLKPEDVLQSAEMSLGYDFVNVNGTWEKMEGHAIVKFNDDYAYASGTRVEYAYGNNTHYVNPKDDEGNECIRDIEDANGVIIGPFEGVKYTEGEGTRKLTITVISTKNLSKLTFNSGTAVNIGDGIESVDFESVSLKKKSDGKSYFANVVSAVTRDEGDNITDAKLEGKVTLKFKDGYTLNLTENDIEDINNILEIETSVPGEGNTTTDTKDKCTVSFSNVEEKLDENNKTVCTFTMTITQKETGISDLQFKNVNVKLNLVLKEYTVKFVEVAVDENGKEKELEYDGSKFSISKSHGVGGPQDSYETDKNYIKVSASTDGVTVYFDINLTKDYVDCKDQLEYEGDNDLEVSQFEGESPHFIIYPEGKTTGTIFTVKIKNLTPNTIYLPKTLNRDETLEKYNIDASAELYGAPNESITIDGTEYCGYKAIGSGLKYKINGSKLYQNWASTKSTPDNVLTTKTFFNVDGTSITNDADSVLLNFANLESNEVLPKEYDVTSGDSTEKKSIRVVNNVKLTGPAEETTTVNFIINSRYIEFLNFVKLFQNADTTWGIDRSVKWSTLDSSQVKASLSYVYHPLAETADDSNYVALEAGVDGFDIKSMTENMRVIPEESDYEGKVDIDANVQNPNALSESKYRIMKLTIHGNNLNQSSSTQEYNFRILNVKYPSYTAEIDVPNNMAQFAITSGFLTDTWTIEASETNNQKLYATYNYNSNISFTVQANSGYTISDVENEIQIYTSQEDYEKGENTVSYKYTEYQNDEGETVLGVSLDNVKTNLYIYVNLGPLHKTITHSKIEGANYYRIEKDGDNYKCKEMIIGRNTVPEGTPYYFMVEAQTGYNIDTLKLSSSDSGELSPMPQQPTVIYEPGNERSSHIKVYELPAVKKNQTISGTIVKDQCSVTFNLDKNYPEALSYKYEGQVLSGSKGVNVDYGQTIEFSTQVNEKYNRSNYKIMLFEKGSQENGRELNLVNGVYTISNITTDKDVRVENIEVNRYSINLVKNDAAEYLDSNQNEIYGVQTVEYNGNYEFTLKANTGYAIGESTQVICTSEDGTKKTLNPDKSGKYRLSNVKEDFTINIMNVDDIYYTVTFIPVEGVTYVNDKDAVVTGSFQIKHGSNFEFGVNVDDAYDDSKAGMYIVINDGKSQNLRSQILYSGRYTINNITEDAEIKVGNIRKNTYTVTLNKVEGMDFYNNSNKIISGDNTVSHGDSLSFKVNLYPAYADSKVKIMLGTQELSADESGFYTVKNVIENKIVTVNGVEETVESKFTNTINNLPDNVDSLSDVDDVISASQVYESMSDEQKSRVGNIDKLKRLQEQVKKFHHVSNDITIEGVDWNIKLFAIPIDNSMDVYTRLYQKLNSEYILSLYNVYLWDTIKDERYNLPEGQSVVISLPTPEMTYFEKPTGIHEKENGKLDYLSLILGSDKVSFTTDSFSPMGVVANRTSTPGRSSLLDTWDANVQAIKDYALSNLNSSGSRDENSASSSEYISDNDSSSGDTEGDTGNISEKFKSRNNPVTPRGSAIRLLLVLLILILLSIIIIIIIENMKKNKDVKK